MSRQFDQYREYMSEEDYYERLVWEREQLANEEWEKQEQLNKHKNYGYVTQKSNPLQSEDQIRA